MKHTNETRQTGFTLIEVMVAITISGLVFLGAFGVIRAGVNTQMFVREMSDAGRQGPAILSQLTTDLNNAAFYNFQDNVFFFGKSQEAGSESRVDQIHFITHRNSLAADPDLSGDNDVFSPLTEVSWILKRGEGEFYELARRESPYVDNKPFQGGYFRLISDRVISFRVQYTGWDLGLGGDEEDESSEPTNIADPEEENEDETLVWEDEWISEDKGCIPSAIKIELLIAPDVDPDVMRRMQVDRRLAQLEKSYIHIVLLPQFREDVATIRDTALWDGIIREPENTGPGAAGARGNGRRGEGGDPNNPQGGPGGARGQRPQNSGNPRNNGNPNQSVNNFLNQLRGGSNGGGNSGGGIGSLLQGGGGNRSPR